MDILKTFYDLLKNKITTGGPLTTTVNLKRYNVFPGKGPLSKNDRKKFLGSFERITTHSLGRRKEFLGL